MGWFLYVVSIVFVAVGVLLVLYTEWTRERERSAQKRDTRLFGLIPIVFGALMVISAAWSEIFWLILILGLLVLAGGVYLLFGSRERIDTATTWWVEEASDKSYRFCGLVLVVLGTAMFSWIR